MDLTIVVLYRQMLLKIFKASEVDQLRVDLQNMEVFLSKHLLLQFHSILIFLFHFFFHKFDFAFMIFKCILILVMGKEFKCLSEKLMSNFPKKAELWRKRKGTLWPPSS